MIMSKDEFSFEPSAKNPSEKQPRLLTDAAQHRQLLKKILLQSDSRTLAEPKVSISSNKYNFAPERTDENNSHSAENIQVPNDSNKVEDYVLTRRKLRRRQGATETGTPIIRRQEPIRSQYSFRKTTEISSQRLSPFNKNVKLPHITRDNSHLGIWKDSYGNISNQGRQVDTMSFNSGLFSSMPNNLAFQSLETQNPSVFKRNYTKTHLFPAKTTYSFSSSASSLIEPVDRKYKYKIQGKSISVPICTPKIEICPKTEHCSFFQKSGFCQRGDSCKYIHCADRVAVCRLSVANVDHDEVKCTYNHSMNEHNMPFCSFFQTGFCKNTTCVYPHVKIAENAQICDNFRLGYCELGISCLSKHVWDCFLGDKCQQPACFLSHPKKLSTISSNSSNTLPFPPFINKKLNCDGVKDTPYIISKNDRNIFINNTDNQEKNIKNSISHILSQPELLYNQYSSCTLPGKYNDDLFLENKNRTNLQLDVSIKKEKEKKTSFVGEEFLKLDYCDNISDEIKEGNMIINKKLTWDSSCKSIKKYKDNYVLNEDFDDNYKNQNEDDIDQKITPHTEVVYILSSDDEDLEKQHFCSQKIETDDISFSYDPEKTPTISSMRLGGF